MSKQKKSQIPIGGPEPSAVLLADDNKPTTRRFTTRANRNNTASATSATIPILYTETTSSTASKPKATKKHKPAADTNKQQHAPDDGDDDDDDDDKAKAKQTKWEPTHDWRLQLQNIRRMHSERSANHQPPTPWIDGEKNRTPRSRFNLLVGLMLSPQTKDTVTVVAMERLRKHGLSVDNILATGEATLAQLIYPVGFYKVKAKHILKTTGILHANYADDIPSTYAELLRLPGVGPKVANICMQSAWQTASGIVVDTHVHRVANRLQWTRQPTADANRTRLELERWMPASEWHDVGELLFWFGQNECTSQRPHCDGCLNRASCAFAAGRQTKTTTAKR